LKKNKMIFFYIICVLCFLGAKSFQLNVIRNGRLYYLDRNPLFQKESFRSYSPLFAATGKGLYYRPGPPANTHPVKLPNFSLGIPPSEQSVATRVVANLIRRFPFLTKVIERRWIRTAFLISNIVFMLTVIFPLLMKSIDEDFDESTSDAKIMERQLRLRQDELDWEEQKRKGWSYREVFRYFAFSSDVGEAIRPVTSPLTVQITYAMTLIYCICDIVYEGYVHIRKPKALSQSNLVENSTDLISDSQSHASGNIRSLGNVLLEKSIFHLFASVLLPGIIIHNVVQYSHDWILLKYPTKPEWYRWVPSLLGLGIIPLLPDCLDSPIEFVLKYLFHRFPGSPRKPDEIPKLVTTSSNAEQPLSEQEPGDVRS
jgi:fission process protein 1